MADHLASIYGTEKDKVNCSFFFKIGACRHGEKCSRKHVKPAFSQTIVMPNIFFMPGSDPATYMTHKQTQEHFNTMYEDFFIELSTKYGEIEEMHVCDNISDHLVGNVYVRFKHEEDAQRAVDDLNNRFYSGRPVWADLSPVTDFREACCRQYDISECAREGFCNFMHLKKASVDVKRDLFDGQRAMMRALGYDSREPRVAGDSYQSRSRTNDNYRR